LRPGKTQARSHHRQPRDRARDRCLACPGACRRALPRLFDPNRVRSRRRHGTDNERLPF